MSCEMSRSHESVHRFMLHAYTEWKMPARYGVTRILLLHRVNRSNRVHYQIVSLVDGSPWILTIQKDVPFRV